MESMKGLINLMFKTLSWLHDDMLHNSDVRRPESTTLAQCTDTSGMEIALSAIHQPPIMDAFTHKKLIRIIVCLCQHVPPLEGSICNVSLYTMACYHTLLEWIADHGVHWSLVSSLSQGQGLICQPRKKHRKKARQPCEQTVICIHLLFLYVQFSYHLNHPLLWHFWGPRPCFLDWNGKTCD